MKKNKQKIKKLAQWMSAVSAEILLVAGAFFVVCATATISATATAYVIGAMLSALGVFIAMGRR